MKVALIGASGFSGSRIRDEALARGHQVTAIVRNPEKITVQNPNLTVVKADILKDDVSEIVKGHDAVIVAHNPGFGNPNVREEQLNGAKALISGTKKAGVKRFLYVGGAGSLEVAPGVRVVDTGKLPAHVEPASRAVADVLYMLKEENELEWTFLCPPPSFQEGERTGHYRLGKDEPVKDAEGKSEISTHDYAIAMIDELEKPQHIRQRFTVAY